MFELVVAQAVREAEQMPAQAGPAMSDLADHRLGDRQRAPGAAGEIDVVVARTPARDGPSPALPAPSGRRTCAR